VCLTDKTNFIEFRKHSGMVNTKFKTTEQDTIHSVSRNPLVWFHIILFTYTTYFGRRKLIFSKYQDSFHQQMHPFIKHIKC